MSQPELVKRAVRALEDAKIAYMLTGSVVSSLQGEPRSTHDVDIVVALDASNAPALLRSFPAPEFYVSEDAVAEAIKTKRMFNVLSVAEGDKIDFWMLTNDPYDQARFERRCDMQFLGVKAKACTPEDTILYKLRWAASIGGSEKQFGDAMRVYEIQRGALDEEYMSNWAGKIGVEAALEKIRTEAELS